MRTVRNIFSVPAWLKVIRLGVLAWAGAGAVSAWAQPANDNFASATVITGIFGTVITNDNTLATAEPGEPSHAGFAATNSVWYKWIAPLDGEVSFDTLGSVDSKGRNLDTVLAVYTGAGLASLSQVAANDDSYPSLRYNGTTTRQFNISGQNTYVLDTNNPPINALYFGRDFPLFFQPFSGPSGLRLNVKGGTTYYIAVDSKVPTYATLLPPKPNGLITLNWAYHSSGVFRMATENIDHTGSPFGNGGLVDTNGNPLLLYQCAETETSRRLPGTVNANQYNTTLHTYYPYNVPGVLVTVTRTAGSSGRVLVDYTTVDGDTNLITNGDDVAKAGQDYTQVSGTLIFNDYEMSKTILIPIIDRPPRGQLDSGAHLNRDFFVKVFNPRLDPAESTDLSPPQVDPTYYQAVVRILDADLNPNGPAYLDVVTAIPPGSTNFFTNTIVTLVPTNAVFNFQKTSYQVGRDVAAYWVGTPITVYVIRTGTNQESQTVHWRVNAGFVTDQGADNRNIEFPLMPGSDYATPNPTNSGGVQGATADFDFPGGYNGTLTFPGGNDRNPQPITFNIIDNGLQQFNEDFQLELYQLDSNGNPYQAGMIAATTVTILYDDLHPPAGSVDEYYNPDLGINMTPPVNRTLPHPGTDGEVYAVAVQADDKALFAGHFGGFNGDTFNGIARALTNGLPDATFNPGDGIFSQGGDFISSLVLQPDGKIIIGGSFPSFDGTLRNGIARLNANGSLDTTFDPGTGANGTVWAVALQTDGKVIVAGDFTSFNGTNRVRVARLNASGGLDTTFDPGANGPNAAVNALAITPAGKIVMGGEFTQLGAFSYNSIARLNADGTLDTTFAPGAGLDGFVYALALQPDGNLLVGGNFSHFNSAYAFGSLVRLTSTGAVDPSFTPGLGANGTVFNLKLASAGTLYIGGAFTAFNGTHRLGLARLYADGTVDTTFLDTAYNQFAGLPRQRFNDSPGTVFSIDFQSDSSVMIGGFFSQVGGGQFDPLIQTNNDLHIWPEPKVRNGIRNRDNIARLIGGATPGPGNVGLLNNAYSANASQSSLYVSLIRTNGTLGPASANFSVLPGLAQSGTDYVYNNSNPFYWITWEYTGLTRMHSDGLWGTNTIFQDVFNGFWSFGNNGPGAVIVSINQNQTTRGNLNASFQLANPIGNDQFYLGGENIPLGVALGRSTAPFTIIDDLKKAGVIGFTASSYFGSSNSAPISVSRTNGSSGQVTVNYATSDGTALVNVDYRSASGQLVFSDGQTNKSFNVQIIQSNYISAVEKRVNLALSQVGGNGVALGLSNAVLRIINPNFQGYLNFSATNFSANLSAGVMVVTVTRTVGSQGTLTVQCVTSNGTAINGLDYVGSTNTLTWNNGDASSRTLSFPLINSGLVGGTKQFFARLLIPTLNGAGAPTLLGAVANTTLTITNDNSYGAFQFSAPSYTVNENGGYATITVTRTGGAYQSVSVNYSTADGINTVATVNYTGTSGTLVFTNGELAKSFTVPVLNDGFIDPSPFFFNVNLTASVPAGLLGFQTSSLVRIVDAQSFNRSSGSADVTLDAAAGMNNDVLAVAVQPDGGIVAGGSFTTANSVPRNRIARLNNDGTLDVGFLAGMSGANNTVNSLLVQSDNRIVIGGAFTFVNGVHRNFIARLTTDGTLDTSFNPNAGADNPVNVVAETFLSGTRKIYMGGAFNNYNGVSRKFIARLNNDGTLDNSFVVPGVDGVVFAIATYPTNSIYAGKVLIGGDFVHINGTARNRLARLNADGSLDATFDPGIGASATVRALAIQSDGRVLLGGGFTNVNGVNLNHVARLNADGSVDAVFISGVGVGADDTVDAIALQPDNRILLGGLFAHASGVTRNRITRLMPNGAIDPTINFGTGANSYVAALALQPDGAIILGGGFTTYNSVPHDHLVRIYGGSIVGSGSFEFTSGTYQTDEISSNVVITVRRVGGTSGPNPNGSGNVTVDFNTSDGTAVAGVNYTTVSSTLAFPVGEVVQTVVIPVFDDQVITPDLTVNLVLTNATGGAGITNQPTAMLTIVNSDSTISFSSPVYSVNKNSPFGIANIDILRQGSTVGAVTVEFTTTTNGTAVIGTDYLNVSNLVTFNPGVSNVTVAIPIINNSLPQGNKTVTLLLTNAASVVSNSVNLFLVAPSAATLTIIDTVQAPGQVLFLATNLVVTEASSNVVVTVLRTNGTSGTISVAYNTIPGTAAPGVNYNTAAGTLTFANGETVKTFNLPLLENSLVQGPVTLNLTLSNPTGGATILGSTNLPVTILDNDAGVAFSSAAYVVNETNGSVTLNVLRLNNTSGTVQVSYATTNGSALANTNYLTTSGTLTFNAGESNKSVIIPVLHDFRATSNLTFGVNLSNPTAGAQLAFPSTASVIVMDAEAGLGFTNANFSVLKSGTNAILTVFCSNPNAEPLSVNYATADGTAVAGINYGAVSGVLTFTNGAVTNYILVPIVNNTLIEGDLNFTVTLSSPTAPGQLIAPSTATVTITDNNAGLSFSSPTYSVFKNSVSATIGVIRTGFTNSTVSVNYATLDGSGTNGVDYSAVSGTLVFTNGQTSLSFTVPVTDSTTVKPDKTVLLQLSNPVGTNGVLVTPSAALLTIHDNSGSLVVPAGVALLTESGPVNGVIDPSESVSLLFALRNSGGTNTANLTATLLATNGITSPSAAQNYGTLLVNGASASRQYSFTASGSNGQQIVATFLLTNGTVSAGSASFTFTLGSGTTSFTNGGAITIPLQGAASPYASTMNVSGVGGSLTKATVTFNKIYHGSASDIDTLLVSPTGQKTLLMANAGGFNGLTGVTLTFDDAAAAYLPQSSPITSGTNKPTPYFPVTVFPAPAPAAPYTTNLAAFNGSNPNGTWSLYVLDDTAVNSGMISNGWVLNLTAVNLVGATADLVAGMTAASSVIVSNNLTYTITVTNYGPSTATGVTLSDTLAASVSLVSSNASQGSVSVVGNQVTWNAGSLLLTNGAVLTLVVKPSTTGILTNNCYVQGNESDPNLVNNAATTTTTVDPIKADLALSLVDAPDPLWSGNNITYTITVTNGGPATAAGVTVTNNLPPSVVFVSASPGGYVLSGNVLAFTNLGNVLVGGQTVATIVVRTTTDGTLTNTAFTASQVTDPLKGNNSATVKTVVNLLQLGGVKSGNNLVISWPTNTPGYVLESATNLNYPAVWTTVVSPAPVVSGGQFGVTNSIGAGAKFFRLRAP